MLAILTLYTFGRYLGDRACAQGAGCWGGGSFSLNLLASISVAAFAINLFIAVFVLAHDRRRLLNQVFFLSGCVLAAWSLSTFVLAQQVAAADALRWTRLMLVCSAIAPVLVLHLVFLLFERARRPALLPCYGVALVLMTMASFGLFESGMRQLPVAAGVDGAYRWYGVGGVLTWLLPINAFAIGAYGINLLLKNVRETSGIRRAQAYYFLVGVAPCVLAGVHDFAGGYFDTYPGTGLTFAPAVPIASAFWAALVGYTILRYRLIDLDAAITRGMVRAVTSAVLVVPFFLVLLAAQQAYHGEVHLDFSMLTLAICALAAFIVPRLSAAAERQLGKALLGQSRSYRDALVAFSREATRILDLDVLIERVNETLTATLGVGAAAVYVAEATGGWRLGGHKGGYGPRLPEKLHESDAIVGLLRSSGEAAVREELQIAIDDGHGPVDAVGEMNAIGADLVIPLTTPDSLEGIILLGARDDGAVFTEEDLAVLTILANQLAGAMANARLYADLKRSREVIQRSERLSAIGTMAAGLAHEIRNPLVSIRTFTQLLPERMEDQEFRDNFFDLTLSEVDRICTLINELLAFARPAPAELESIDINDCLERICLLLDSQARGGGARLTRRLYAETLELTADEDQVKQVVMNVILNAIQACGRSGGDGTVEVWSYPNRVDGGDYVCIEISDNGGGIDDDLIGRIFDPFVTTRREGTGLGLSIAHQIVTRHGGFIDVRTGADKGTAFYVNLPVEPPAFEPAPVVYDSEAVSLHG